MEEAAEGGGGQCQAVNPDCPNAANPFHRCAPYCPVPAPLPAKFPPPPAQNGDAHSDGELRPKPRRGDRRGDGSGGLPLYVFLREGSDGEGRRVDPRCPNAANPYHVCTDHCLAKMVDASRSLEGAGSKSPVSLFSRHSRRSRSSSSEEGSVKSADSRKVDSKCPNASNPFHECAEYCASKIQQEAEKKEAGKKKETRKKGGKDIKAVTNWKVDPRCPHAGNPFHICAQYCFDHLNEMAQAEASKSDMRKGKTVLKAEGRGDVNSDCVNASNPYHKCGEHCTRRKLDR